MRLFNYLRSYFKECLNRRQHCFTNNTEVTISFTLSVCLHLKNPLCILIKFGICTHMKLFAPTLQRKQRAF